MIATDCGGPAEIIDAPKTGLLVPVGDVAAMTAALHRLLGDPGTRASMAQQAYTSVRRKFNTQATAGALSTIYSIAIGNARSF